MKKVDKRKKTIKTIALSIVAIILLGGLLFLTFKELLTEEDIQNNNNYQISDAEKFKKEFEDVNNTTSEDKNCILVNINNNNPINYITEQELIDKIDAQSTFMVFFGYSKCPWCRAVIENLVNESIEKNIDKIYYLDVENIRDEYKLNDNKQLELVNEGTKEYKVLLNKLDPVLDSYESFKYLDTEGNEIIVPVNEKRIYGPSLMIIKDGVPVKMVSGISSLLKDPCMPQSDEMLNESKNIFDDIYDEYNSYKNSNACYETSNC